MPEPRKSLHEIRFECDRGGFVLAMTFAVDREVVVEQIPLGSMDPAQVMESLRLSIAQLRQDEAATHTPIRSSIAGDADTGSAAA